jgi:hypothetical protein
MNVPPKKTRVPLKKRLLVYCAIIVGCLGIMVALILIAWAVPLGDFAPVQPLPKIKGIVSPIKPDAQTEGHTCGFHAVSSIYKSYGLDPVERRLRARLGTDNRSIIYDSTTTGSLHPDIYRVLAQDGFDCRFLDLEKADAQHALKDHLTQGRYALALIQRRENGNMHWVVLAGLKESALKICDPLKPETYEEDLQDYWSKCILSINLLTPSSQTAQPSLWRLHLAGLRDMYHAFDRKGSAHEGAHPAK